MWSVEVVQRLFIEKHDSLTVVDSVFYEMVLIRKQEFNTLNITTIHEHSFEIIKDKSSRCSCKKLINKINISDINPINRPSEDIDNRAIYRTDKTYQKTKRIDKQS